MTLDTLDETLSAFPSARKQTVAHSDRKLRFCVFLWWNLFFGIHCWWNRKHGCRNLTLPFVASVWTEHNAYELKRTNLSFSVWNPKTNNRSLRGCWQCGGSSDPPQEDGLQAKNPEQKVTLKLSVRLTLRTFSSLTSVKRSPGCLPGFTLPSRSRKLPLAEQRRDVWVQ